MVKREIRKNLTSVYFYIGVLMLYLVFMLGNSGEVLKGGSSTTIIGAIWNKFHGNWQQGAASSCLYHMYNMWNGNRYLPIVMPIACGLPGILTYLDELQTGNKKMILARCSARQYYTAKIAANAVTALCVSMIAAVLFYITLFWGYDWLPESDAEFSIMYVTFCGTLVDDIQDISMGLIYAKLVKGLIYFGIYGVMGSSFCYWMAVWVRDRYVMYGAVAFLVYCQVRIEEELLLKYIQDGMETAGTIGDIISPIFLHYAGASGFYQHREWAALLIAVMLIVMNYTIAVRLSQKSFDITER